MQVKWVAAEGDMGSGARVVAAGATAEDDMGPSARVVAARPTAGEDMGPAARVVAAGATTEKDMGPAASVIVAVSDLASLLISRLDWTSTSSLRPSLQLFGLLLVK